MNVDVIIRTIEPTDGDSVSLLAGRMGFQRTAAEIRAWLATTYREQHQHTAFVACAGEIVIGWLEISIEHRVQSAPFAQIHSIFLREDFRHRGIRRLLCAHAEAWAWQQGADAVRVNCSTRPGAQQFYVHEGYQEIKGLLLMQKPRPV